MRPRALAALVVVGALAIAASAAIAIVATPHRASTPAAMPLNGALFPPGIRAPDFNLRDQHGRPFAWRAATAGRPAVVTFLYTHCHESCPAEAQQIKGAFDDLGHDLPAIAISVDPGSDTAASARRFLGEQGMDARIRFALGDDRSLAPLWRTYAVTRETKKAEHMALIVLVDRRGYLRVSYPQSQTTPERLAHDLRILEAERA